MDVFSTELIKFMVYPFETQDLSGNKTEIYHSMLDDLEQWRQSVIKSATEEVKCYGVSQLITDDLYD